MGSGVPEIGFILCQAIGFEFYGFAGGILADEDEVAIVGDENLAVLAPIAADLFAIGGEPRVVGCGFDFNDPASGILWQ